MAHTHANPLNPMVKTKSYTTVALTLIFLLLLPVCNAASKRGLAYIADSSTTDVHLLTTPPSPLSWYYTWSAYPSASLPSASSLEFTPMIHNLDDTNSARTATVIQALPKNSTHLLTFNEPDGTTSSGGSSISPEDAARAYVNYVLPYRSGQAGGGRKWQISHPVTTGSPRGLQWLRDFNASCYRLNTREGCPLDFITAHWYGDTVGLRGWLTTLDDFYNTNTSRNPPLKMWVTELGLPQQNAQQTMTVLNSSLGYLDGWDRVERYAWFGAFRSGKGKGGWAGDGGALFDGGGGLTDVGALYMGSGFREGQKGTGQGSGGGKRRVGWWALWGLGAIAVVFGGL